MPARRARLARFPLRGFFVLILGIAIGYSLNLETVRLLFGAPIESRMMTLPAYVIEPPDVLLVKLQHINESEGATTTCLVDPSGDVTLESGAVVPIAGLTIEEAQHAISEAVAPDFIDASVNVFAYNSKAYYIVMRKPSGDSVVKQPITGNDTVMDAIVAVGGVDNPSGRQISVHRPSERGVGSPTVLPVTWEAASGGVTPSGNYQLFPGDRVVIEPAPNESAS